MKKLLALLLTLTMLIGMVGTLASAEQIKPTLAYPNVTTTVSDEGLLTVALGEEIQNLSMLRVDFEDDVYWPAVDGEYDAEKKAYTLVIDKGYAGKTPESVELNTWVDKEGKVDTAQYAWEDGKIASVDVSSGKREEDETAKTTTYVMSGRYEEYEEGALSSYSENSWTNVYTSVEGGYTQKETKNYKVYDEDGILTRTGVINYEESDVDKEDEKESSASRTHETKDEYKQNNQFGAVRTTGTKITNGYKNNYFEDKEKGTYTQTYGWYNEETIYNKKGVKINYDTYKNFYTSGSETEAKEYKNEYMRYDAYGNLLNGYSEELTNAKETTKYYSNGALSSSSEWEYKVDDKGNQGDWTKHTDTNYSNNRYGVSVVSSQNVYTPNKKTYKDKDGNEKTRSLADSYTNTYYNKDGAVTSVETYAQDYGYSADEKAYVTTSTTTRYVGAVSDAELKSKTVYTSKNYDNGDYANWTVTTDSTGKEISRTGESNIHTPATETEKEKTVYTRVGSDSKTVRVYSYDADNRSYRTEETTNKDGKVTYSYRYAYDKEEAKYVGTSTYNDKDGNLIGKSYNKDKDGGNITTYYDKDGKLVYKKDYTYPQYKDGKWTSGSTVYTDADGKEIGYEKTDDKGQINNKVPEFNLSTFKLNGWKEKTTERQDNKTTKETNKTYNKAGALTYESVLDNTAGTTTTTWYSLWDDGKTLATYANTFTEKAISTYSTQKEITNVTTTYNQNPNYVKSKVQINPADKVETNDKGQTTKRESKSTTEYYDLTGALDRAEVTTKTTTYTYDEDGDYDTNTVTVKEWKNASGSAVVTKTTNNGAKSGENRVEYKKADGTLIGYEKTTTNDDKSWISESVSADFNPYTGYVRSSSKHVWTYDKDGEPTKEEYQELNEKGEVTSKRTEEYTKTGGSGSEAHYYEQEDGALALGWDNAWKWDDKAGTSSSNGAAYYPSGKVGRTWEETETYDKEKDVWNVTRINKDVNGNVVLTQKGTIDRVAGYVWEEVEDIPVYDLTYTDAKGNVVGYKKTDANGTVTEKIPFDPDHANGGETAMTLSGKLNKGWKETVKDVWNNTVSEKIYNAKGQLMSESYRQADASSETDYWRWTGSKAEAQTSATKGGITTTTTTYYNEDGTMRKTVVNAEGRASGTHIETNKTTVSNADGVVYTYEYTKDLQTDKSSGVYKDATGKEIGHYTYDAETGARSELSPTVGRRTGKITGFTLSETDKDGVFTYNTYDAGMTLLSSSSSYSKKGTNEDGYTTTSYYRDGSDKAWKVETFYRDDRYVNGSSVYGSYTETAKYNKDGVKYASEEYQSYGQGLTRSETRYYDKDGKLVYSRVEMREPNRENGYSEYAVYLGADGKEIARQKTEDNGDRVEKYPDATAGNVITGYYEIITSDDGTVTIERRYDENNVLVGETYRKETVVVTDDQITRTTAKKDGTVVNKTVDELNEDRELVKRTETSYSSWNGQYTGEVKYYPASDDYRWPAYKNYDANGNLIIYGWTWDEDDYEIKEYYWVNGQLEEYSWSDDLEEDGSFLEAYNADGSYYKWVEDDGNGTRAEWSYGSDGKLDTLKESTPDGVTNVTYYNKDGSIRGYDWGITSGNYGGELYKSPEGDVEEGGGLWYQDSVVWDANNVLYNKHIEQDPESNVSIETWKDTAGNVKVSNVNGTTVTLTNSANGWHKAFGSEWYYVEGGQIVTGWKQLDGTWYYFDKSGKMATGVFADDKTVYVADKDGAWVASGWNQDASGNYQYIENGTAVTGWKMIGGKWYYFYDGWEIAGSYDSNLAWKQYTGGNMATGAYDIWNDSWTEKITYFFNADGSWDTTPGWKTNGIDTFYFYRGGERATGWKQIGKDWYYFANNGVMRNGWVGSGSSWYYMDPETGKMVDGDWIQERFEHTWYYADKGGLMATGWRQIDGDWYYFNSDGDMASQQWVKSGSDWYFMKKDGDMATGWAQDKDEKWYYMDNDGVMESSKWIGDDASGWYYVGEDGAMLTGTQTIDGRVNIFDENGLWIGYGD